MLSAFLWPGDLVCNLAGLPHASDHRQVLRSFVNMMVWAAVMIAVVLYFDPVA
ncbi:hypothetical protein [Hyphomicrobium sp.]|jgi:hypothetical protein|uniref:hypothetical protein n=1 Tax=Hyphomicrobium sp. TaxID=82 RepID=UPI002BDA5894|nr:hypothetical protein [Hyphomicrobium sp.]HVZ04074.1 hypothetical protein [Hyphomicrobium sp.]